MEKEKNNRGLVCVLVVIIVLLLCAVGYLLFGKDLLNKNNSSTSTDNNNIQTTDIKSADELYNEYLLNLKKEIENEYKEYSDNVINGKSMSLDTDYKFTIKNNLDLVFTTGNNKYSDYKISENVLNMFLIDVGNGGYKYLYFIRTDGSLNKMCIDCLSEDSTVKVETENKKNIVNITQGLFGYNYSGAHGPIFIDIEGNIETE